MKVLKLIVIGLIFIILSSITCAMLVHNEKIDPVWERICAPEDELQKGLSGHCDWGSISISENYTLAVYSLYGATYMDQSCVEEFNIETHSAGYIYQVCTRAAIRSDIMYILDTQGNVVLDYSPGAAAMGASISGNYAALGSANNLIHFFKLTSEGKWIVAWKYTTESTPRSVYISGNSVYAGDNNNIYSINKEDGSLKWKYVIGSPVIQVQGTNNGIVAGSNTAVYFIDGNGNLIKKQDTGTVNSIYVDGDNVAVGAGSNIYFFDANGNLKFNYKTDAEVSDVEITPEGNVIGSAGENMYLLDLNGELKEKFSVADIGGIIDSIDMWGKYIGAGVISDNNHNYLFDENGVADIRHGDESEKTGTKVKSVINKGEYGIVTHTVTYANNMTNDKIKFYKLGFARAKDLLIKAQFAVGDVEKTGFDIADAKAEVNDAEKSFAEDDYPETFRHARLSEGFINDKIEKIIYDTEKIINASKNTTIRTIDAEALIVSAINSLVRKEYSNAIIYARNAEEMIKKLTIGEAEAEVADARMLLNGVKSIEGFDKVVNVHDIEKELNTSDALINEGKYAEAIERANKSKNIIDQGLIRYMEGLIEGVEKKLDDAKAWNSQLLQAEEMSIAEDNIDKAKKSIEEGKKGNYEKLFEVPVFVDKAAKGADQAKTRTWIGYLMGVVLLWAIFSALVIMMLKPKWPASHYPGLGTHEEPKSKKKRKIE